ncbi:hypothetical protein FS837_003365 [Tulasnella sp. UAMH 9824]|nr:hypothetical protein FS837_003365 [Tulasnella sp. UAMH 9824]
MSRYERVLPYDQVDGEYTPQSPAKIPLLPPSRRRSSASGSIFAAERNPPPKTFIPFYIRTWVVLSVALAMILLAAGVEIALFRSQMNQGWRIHGLQLLGGINFLKSVVPVVLTVPISIFWNSVDRDIGRFQPYVSLSKGRATADRSLLLDYTQGRTDTILRSLRYGHWAVLLSSFVCMANLALSPLAAGLLTTHNAVIVTPNVQIQAVKTLGLDPDYVTLEYFNAAAGYSMAAAINNLTDPPFLFKGSWAIQEFEVPSPIGSGVNQTIVVPTTAIESTAGCEPADTVSFNSAVAIGSNMTITGTWDGCTVTFGANHTGNDGYGVLPLNNCATHTEPAPFLPVLFWMYSAELDKVEMTFCQPKIDLWNVVAEASLVTGQITNVTLIDQNIPANNISGPPLNGVPFNGVEFDVGGANLYVKARALSVQTGVAGAVYRGADPYGGAAVVMQTDNGYLNITETVYTRFLALVAKSTYFNDVGTTIEGKMDSYDVRLAVYSYAAHAFAAALTFIAVMATVNHFVHTRERGETKLACAPTTIAGIVSTASYSNYGRIQCDVEWRLGIQEG